MVASECGTASGDAGVHASQGGGNGASRWSGRRGSNSRPLPWQGPGSILYSGEAENGLDAPTYPEYACVSTLIPRGATRTTWQSMTGPYLPSCEPPATRCGSDIRFPWRSRVGPALESWLRRAVAYWLAGEDRPQSGAVLEVPPFFGEGHVSAGAEGVVEQTA